MTCDDLFRLAVTQTWQLAVMIAVVAIVIRLFAQDSPQLAHVLWLAVFLKALFPPIWSSPCGLFSLIQITNSRTEARQVVVPDEFAGGRVASGDPVDHDHGAPAATVVAAARSSPMVDRSLKTQFPKAFTIAWFGGVILLWLLTIARYLRFRRRVDASSQSASPMLGEFAASLARRLNVRRPVQLLVTRRPIGPAVVGLWRQTLILPAFLVDGRSTQELEPVLAHELIHVRRGDLLTAMLQSTMQCVWWFHPLVWWAVRAASRNAEHCCDRETVAALNCPPSQYARTLLDVLAERQLVSMPRPFPGIRAVDLTSQRLERIMRIRQGCQSRTSFWYWVLFAATAAVTLPGAAFVAAQSTTLGGTKIQTTGATAAGSASLIDTAVDHAPSYHQPFGDDRDQLIEIQAQMISGPKAKLAQLIASINLQPLAVPDRSLDARIVFEKDRALPKEPASFAQPIVWSLLEAEAAHNLIATAQNDQGTNLVVVPRLTVKGRIERAEGDTPPLGNAKIVFGKEKKFRMNYLPDADGKLKPLDRTFCDGVSLVANIVGVQEEQTKIELTCEQGEVGPIRTVTGNGPDGKPHTFEIPDGVTSRRVTTHCDLVSGQSMLLTGLTEKNGDKTDAAAIVVSVQLIPPTHGPVLELENLAFCHKIESFGNYKPYRQNEFTAGQPVLLYAEIANFNSDVTSNGQFRTILKSTIEILDKAGKSVQRMPFAPTEDCCLKHARLDYYNSFEFSIPPRLAAGSYTLKLIVEDQMSQQVATSDLSFTVK